MLFSSFDFWGGFGGGFKIVFGGNPERRRAEELADDSRAGPALLAVVVVVSPNATWKMQGQCARNV